MNWPETNVALFAFLLNLPWELWQIPLFKAMPLLGTGLAPLLQWLLIPPLVVWLVRRQIP